MNDKRYVARNTAIASRALGPETMVMSAADSTLFTLDEMATVIWESVNGTTPIEEIVRNKICPQYAVAPEVALREAEAFVDALAAHGLLLVSDKPIARPGSSPRESR
jgi:Coenzyme PQQ synthesis protein D (PqqD)